MGVLIWQDQRRIRETEIVLPEIKDEVQKEEIEKQAEKEENTEEVSESEI